MIVVARGVVVSGKGVGSKFVSLRVYNELLTALLGDKPFSGTLNVVLNGLDISRIIIICPPYTINDIVSDNEVYGGLYYWYCRVSKSSGDRAYEESAIVLRPFRSSHHGSVVEIVSTKYLRSAMNLADGDIVTIKFLCRQ